MRKWTATAIILVFSLLCVVLPAYAQQEGDPERKVMELSLDNAVKRALDYSRSLEKSQMDLDKAYDARVWAPVTDYTTYTPAGETRIFAAESTSFAYENARRAHELQQDSVRLDVTKKYYDILIALEKLESKRSILAQAEADVRVTRAMVSVGMISRLALDGANVKLDMAKADLAAAKAEMDNAYLALNQLVRFNVNERPVLVDTVTFVPVSLELGIYESRVLRENPSLEMARAAADYMKSVENYTVGGEVKVASTDVKKADLDLETARDGVQRLIRHLYSGVKTLEESYAEAERGLAIAVENRRIAQLKYEIGMTTRTEVLKAESELAAAKERLLGLASQHAYLKLALEKPWAYVGISGSM